MMDAYLWSNEWQNWNISIVLFSMNLQMFQIGRFQDNILSEKWNSLRVT